MEQESAPETPTSGSNIRVAVRCRPFFPSEQGQHARSVHMTKTSANLINPVTKQQRKFTFDSCYDSSGDIDGEGYASQQDIYSDIGVWLVDNSLRGYNTCIFAYGQTGSGKTYTMLGPDGTWDSKHEDAHGLIPRICAAHFDYIQSKTKRNITEPTIERKYSVMVSFAELYMEQAYDLLTPEAAKRANAGSASTSPGDPTSGAAGWRRTAQSNSYNGRETLRLREHPLSGPFIEGLTQTEVSSLEEIQSLMERGASARTTGVTKMNEQSSRSHAIFTMTFTQTAIATDRGVPIEKKECKVSLVDLAGSERADPGGSRIRETANINKGLLTLGRVISALTQNAAPAGEKRRRGSVSRRGSEIRNRSNSGSKSSSRGTSPMKSGSTRASLFDDGSNSKSEVVPYRESVLTWLLKESLGGNAKTAMIAAISPAPQHFEETMSTLCYADQARGIVNQAKVNDDPAAVVIRQLREELVSLKTQLREAQWSLSRALQFTEPTSESEGEVLSPGTIRSRQASLVDPVEGRRSREGMEMLSKQLRGGSVDEEFELITPRDNMDRHESITSDLYLDPEEFETLSSPYDMRGNGSRKHTPSQLDMSDAEAKILFQAVHELDPQLSMRLFKASLDRSNEMDENLGQSKAYSLVAANATAERMTEGMATLLSKEKFTSFARNERADEESSYSGTPNSGSIDNPACLATREPQAMENGGSSPDIPSPDSLQADAAAVANSVARTSKLPRLSIPSSSLASVSTSIPTSRDVTAANRRTSELSNLDEALSSPSSAPSRSTDPELRMKVPRRKRTLTPSTCSSCNCQQGGSRAEGGATSFARAPTAEFSCQAGGEEPTVTPPRAARSVTIMEGQLYKKTRWGGYRLRLIKVQLGVLTVWKSVGAAQPKLAVQLLGNRVINTSSSSEYTFDLMVSGMSTPMHFKAQDQTQHTRWIELLEQNQRSAASDIVQQVC
ncbi:hypothetical protein CYMTET_52312 [Cymbomonas tetramitiformis]|uniref:Kinesin-like protein n=1 Tax=Cymbomonas tetramitiformis TaxID=36881 RepID=A0AAE0BL31_9CHLO|nr:hypothetical protein CYMTET_52312 [Cymbomonas tetramitiformis]